MTEADVLLDGAADADILPDGAACPPVIETEPYDDVVLCGHSYGGMVITGVTGSGRCDVRWFHASICVSRYAGLFTARRGACAVGGSFLARESQRLLRRFLQRTFPGEPREVGRAYGDGLRESGGHNLEVVAARVVEVEGCLPREPELERPVGGDAV